jgi:hypothetical protein
MPAGTWELTSQRNSALPTLRREDSKPPSPRGRGLGWRATRKSSRRAPP